MKAIGYTRVSTAGQAEDGVSLDAQKAKVTAQADLLDMELVEVIEDAGYSAKNLRRPGAARLMELVDRRQVDAVIIHKLDRLTRSVADLALLLDTFKKRGVKLISVSESLNTATAAGELVINLLASVAQWERRAIGERTRDAMAQMKAQGQRVGTVPFGYAVAEDGVTLIEEPAEQEALSVLSGLRASGYSYRQIAAELNRQGYTTRRGTAWRHQYVAALAA